MAWHRPRPATMCEAEKGPRARKENSGLPAGCSGWPEGGNAGLTRIAQWGYAVCGESCLRCCVRVRSRAGDAVVAVRWHEARHAHGSLLRFRPGPPRSGRRA